MSYHIHTQSTTQKLRNFGFLKERKKILIENELFAGRAILRDVWKV